MLKRVRSGYAYVKGTKIFGPGDTVDITEEDFRKKHWIFEPDSTAEKRNEERQDEEKQDEEKQDVSDEVIPQNKAVLDSKSGAPLIRRGTVNKNKG
jgi:hypothetical protein